MTHDLRLIVVTKGIEIQSHGVVWKNLWREIG